jgi:hypothetical protein
VPLNRAEGSLKVRAIDPVTIQLERQPEEIRAKVSGPGGEAKVGEAIARLAAVPIHVGAHAGRTEQAASNAIEGGDESLAELEPSRRKKARGLEVGCDEGDGNACVKLGDLLLTDATMESEARARSAWERACKFGRASGCAKAGEVAEAAGDAAGARVLFERACRLGLKTLCKGTVTSTSLSGAGAASTR